MTATEATWIMHPGVYIKEEMDERGWSQRDLAFIMKVPEQAISLILREKRGISPEMAHLLGDAFGVSPDFFANLQKAYEMAQAKKPSPDIALRGRMLLSYPVREMVMREWLQDGDAAMLETQLVRFFEVDSPDEIPYMPHAAKKSSYEEREVPPAQLAWLFRVRQVAKSFSTPQYSEASLRAALTDLQSLLITPEEARHVPKIMRECGVRYVVVEKLPNAKIDGVCFWLDNSPVIGMSMQHDRIDNFWFVLRHEIEHVLQGHGRDEEMIDADLEGTGASTNSSVPEEEQIANQAAQDFCAPRDRLDSFLKRKHPFYYEKDVVAFSRILNRHPGIVIGQMRRRLNRYDYLTRYLVKIRQYVVPSSIADGWGQIIPISL
jgi:HTH-type transcriptional regulator/antitoxin HigA